MRPALAATLLLLATSLTVQADSRTDPTHVAAEHANLCQIDRAHGTLLPAECVTPSPTIAPTATNVPKPLQNDSGNIPTSVETPTPTPAPLLPVPAEGADWLSGYLRPSDWNDGVTLELALQSGRWDIRLSDPTCVGAWRNVAMAPDAQLAVTTVADGVAWTGMCQIAAASWRSDATCSTNADGRCDVYVDDSYWYAMSLQPTDTPTPAPTQITAPARAPPVKAAVVAPQPAPALSLAATPVPPATPAPTYTPYPTYTPVPTLAPTMTRTPTPTVTATVTRTPVSTSTPRPQPTATAAPTATGFIGPPAPRETLFQVWMGMLAQTPDVQAVMHVVSAVQATVGGYVSEVGSRLSTLQSPLDLPPPPMPTLALVTTGVIGLPQPDKWQAYAPPSLPDDGPSSDEMDRFNGASR